MKLVLIAADGCRTEIDFGIKHPDEHARDALPILERLLTASEPFEFDYEALPYESVGP